MIKASPHRARHRSAVRSPRHLGRRGGWLVGLMITLLATPVLASSANAVTDCSTVSEQQQLEIVRIAGTDRYNTAVCISQTTWADHDGVSGELPTAQAVVLARGDNYPDALAGGPLAAHAEAPMLLTQPTKLPGPVMAEIRRVLPIGGQIYLLGGTSSISNEIRDRLDDAGYSIKRLAGANRFETAVKIADELPDTSTFFFVTGTNFPDALAAGNAAANLTYRAARGEAGAEPAAILLTNGDEMAAPSRKFAVERRQELGGWTLLTAGGAADRAAKEAFGESSLADRFVGRNRYDTAVQIAEEFFTDGNGQLLLGGIGVSTGSKFPDALAATSKLAQSGQALLLTANHVLSPEAAAFLEAHSNGNSFVEVFGGTTTLSHSVVQDIAWSFRDNTSPANPTVEMSSPYALDQFGQTVAELVPATLTLQALDADAKFVSYSLTNTAEGDIAGEIPLVGGIGTLTFQPNYGRVEIGVTVWDRSGNSSPGFGHFLDLQEPPPDPPGEPVVTISEPYQLNASQIVGVLEEATLTIETNEDDVDHFVYWIDHAGSTVGDYAGEAPISNGTGEFTFQPHIGHTVLYFQLVAESGTPGPVVSFYYEIARAFEHAWMMNEGTPDIAADLPGSGLPLTFSNDVSWVAGGDETGGGEPGDLALHFDGGGAGAWTGSDPLSGTSSFTVAARVQLDDLTPADDVIAVSKDGADSSVFNLGLRDGLWSVWGIRSTGESFSFDASAPKDEVDANGNPVPDGVPDWQHVAIAYDDSAGWISLFVDGDFAGGGLVDIASSSGGLRVGAGLKDGVFAGTSGAVDDVATVRSAQPGWVIERLILANTAGEMATL